MSELSDLIRNFDWGNYGLDALDPNVNPEMSDEWAVDLAMEIGWYFNERRI
jgi:hypothetical protein